ncbi:MAG: cyclic nucleotide-binding domain-containing protein [Desulfobacterales bacterium]|jgi:CRP-like cAMP-binding protein|nr:cyclic nucleotide-binding domain-containing protein [Desulfobacterales bacterium]
MTEKTTISEKIVLLKRIELFESLSVGELAAIASVAEEVDYPAGEIIIKEGDAGDTLFLMVSGEVSVIKDLGEINEIEIDRMTDGEYFGEMALFEDTVRSVSIRTEKPSAFMVLHKQEFKEIVREYPQIALEICKILSRRIRHLHRKIEDRDYCKENISETQSPSLNAK